MSTVKFRPLHDRVLVQPIKEEITKGGIIIPDTAKEKPLAGKVIAIGTGKYLEDGKVRAMDVKVGDEVLFGKYAGTEIKLGQVDYLVLREEDIMGIMQ